MLCHRSRTPIGLVNGRRPPILALSGWAGQGVAYPTLCLLLAPTPLAIGELVRVPDLAVALIPLQDGFVCVTVWAVIVCVLRRTLRWWLWGSRDAEPL
jgi:hypothetical protein